MCISRILAQTNLAAANKYLGCNANCTERHLTSGTTQMVPTKLYDELQREQFQQQGIVPQRNRLLISRILSNAKKIDKRATRNIVFGQGFW
jgi:hypothetical protein